MNPPPTGRKPTHIVGNRPVGRWGERRLHFVGVGGAGMSGLALVCAELGAAVSGSDRGDSSYMERLRRAGLEPVVGHDAANLPDGAEVIVSTAIGADNPGAGARSRARPRRPPSRRAAGRALRREAADRRRRHARQDDDDRDAGLGAAQARRGPGVLRRRRGSRARPGGRYGERRLGDGGVGRRRGRRERRQLPRPEARDRRRHQHRDGPPLALGLDRRAARGLRAVRRKSKRRPGQPSPRRTNAALATLCGANAAFDRFDAVRSGAERARSVCAGAPQRAQRARRSCRGRALRASTSTPSPPRSPISPESTGGSS